MVSPQVAGAPGVAGKPQQSFWCGTVGSTWWFYFTGPCTDDVWNAYLAHCRAMVESSEPRPSLICIAHRADAPSSDQRKVVADFIRAESARLSSLVGFAMVLDSPLHLFALRAINWLVKKPFPEKAFGSPITAAQWLVERGAALDADVLRNALEERVPRQHLGIL